ncbi:hypothetical protein LshimejAT787_0210130 [Lyophyllum shimeji]|uniref:Uncharacterized protein n=1 Tax=Lyophyllum shimeji TaxID=47721 RepID=A0A9P3PHB5_LYOSH|nr:hypothetical protein LshimejAT787_0210130 [Lyophyllum shimeji]
MQTYLSLYYRVLLRELPLSPGIFCRSPCIPLELLDVHSTPVDKVARFLLGVYELGRFKTSKTSRSGKCRRSDEQHTIEVQPSYERMDGAVML